MDYLYDGMLYPAKEEISRDPEYLQASKRQETLMNQLKDRLKDEEYKLVEEMCDCDLIVQDKMAFEFFRHGFCLGMALMKEARECLEDATKSMTYRKAAAVDEGSDGCKK
ncbi:MAG: hypothetical protein LIP12_00370 [Clostridiales bacterium]|nr:hypothetical protein [Clostridiales bacterium]